MTVRELNCMCRRVLWLIDCSFDFVIYRRNERWMSYLALYFGTFISTKSEIFHEIAKSLNVIHNSPQKKKNCKNYFCTWKFCRIKITLKSIKVKFFLSKILKIYFNCNLIKQRVYRNVGSFFRWKKKEENNGGRKLWYS